jgi:uncharacterized membrane protein
MAVSLKNKGAKRAQCHVCGKSFPLKDVRPWISVRPTVSEMIHSDYPDWGDGKFVCHADLGKYRHSYVAQLLEQERGELSTLENQVVESLQSGQIISEDPADYLDASETFGERMADHVASFGGSWTFIMLFAFTLFSWMLLNITGWLFEPFDMYPFILLNLVLSCLAAAQAPIIMMSQRRQEVKDRRHAENDYRVNLKAELEIRQLHEKLDHQLAQQWERLAEIQQIQIELLEERR